MNKIFSAIISSPLKGRLGGVFLALLATTTLWAHDFAVDGVFYNILNENNVEVTYKGRNSNSYEEYSGEVTIPETVTYKGTTYSVTSIGGSAFEGCISLTSVTIGNSVTSIGGWAFKECSSLTSITIPNSVTSIGDWAFADTGIYNDESNWENDVLYIDNYLIDAKESISGTYTIKENTRLIASEAFRYCSSLTSITIPNSVTSIGGSAFEGCISLTSVTIGNSVTSIGYNAFDGCSSLTSITIPNSVTSIGSSAFSGCSSLTSITIPNSVTSIGDMAFWDCHALTSITIPSSVTSIGDYAFWNCEALTSVTIPNSVTSIGNNAFCRCSNLTSIVVESGNSTYDSRENCNAIIETATNTLIAGCQNTIIPNSVTSIGEGAFCGCRSLTSITIPNSVTSIGNDAFSGCSSLTSITIPNSVTSIGWGAFCRCSSLTSITIPNSVTSIGEQAFLGCSSLKTVICEAIEVPELLGGNVFYDMPLSEATLYVPAQSLDDYKAAEQWKEFGTILPLDKAPSAVENTRLPITNSTKLLRNGQVYILQDGKTYTITGQRF